VGGLVLFGGSGEEIPSAFTTTTTTVPATTTITTTTTEPATTTTTTTTTVPPRVTLQVEDDSSPNLAGEIAALYTWMVDPGVTPPPMIEGLGAHLETARSDGALNLTASVSKDELADGTKVAVVEVGDDVILATAAGSRWEIVGARLSSFDLGPWYGEPIRHVLIIGTDARPHQSQPDFRADSIHIIAASLDDGGGGVVGFPRDTYVATSYGSDKYSSVNVRGSTGEMVRIAEDLSGIEMEGYILTGFAGFKHLVNAFGGVEVQVPFRMSDDSSNAFLDAGLQLLRGGDALAFSRNRHISGGDFTRSRHQGVVIKAGLTGAQIMGIDKLPRIGRQRGPARQRRLRQRRQCRTPHLRSERSVRRPDRRRRHGWLVVCRRRIRRISPALDAPGGVLRLDASTDAPSLCVLAGNAESSETCCRYYCDTPLTGLLAAIRAFIRLIARNDTAVTASMTGHAEIGSATVSNSFCPTGR